MTTISFHAVGFQAKWEIALPSDDAGEIQKIEDACGGATNTCGCCLMNRTHNWKVFAKDFFLPVFVNHVLKIKNAVYKVIAAIFAISLDLMTFPLRCVFLPLSYKVNQLQYEQNPMVKYLKTRDALPALLEAERVVVQMKYENGYVRAMYANLRNQPCGGGSRINGRSDLLTEKEIQEFET